MTGKQIPLSIIILTLNEADNISECLQCLKRAEDVILVDSGSTDETIELARATRSDVRVKVRPFTDFGDQRNWALDNTAPRQDWILFVDADEFCDDILLDEVAEFIESPGNKVGAFVAGKNYFLGRWLKHAMLYPSYQLRLLKKGEVRFRKHGHGQREVTNGPLHYLKNGWRHEAYSKGVAEWIVRHNRYSTAEVGLLAEFRREPLGWSAFFREDGQRRRRFLKRLSSKLPMRPAFTFAYLYVLKRGFLDGYPGLLYCLLMTSHHVHVMAKIAEAEHRAHARIGG